MVVFGTRANLSKKIKEGPLNYTRGIGLYLEVVLTTAKETTGTWSLTFNLFEVHR